VAERDGNRAEIVENQTRTRTARLVSLEIVTVKITTLPAIPVAQLKAKLKSSKQMGKR
jgi:hypothetical protein